MARFQAGNWRWFLVVYTYTVAAGLAWLIAGAWCVQAVVVHRGLRSLPSLLDPSFPTEPGQEVSVVVIVPACNEENAIAPCIRSLLDQDWPKLHIIAVDDRSTDATGSILDELAREHSALVTVLHITTLPTDWLGKTHAMAVAARQAKLHYDPTWLLFTDADVIFHPECLRRSLAVAEAMRADHFVTAPTALVYMPGEAAIMSFLQVIGLWASRLWRVANPKTRDAVGIGAFNLLRSSTYWQIGGFETLRFQILEDLSLARLVKNAGFRQRVALARGYVCIHWAAGTRGVLNTMTKNLFAIFRFRLAPMLLACLVLALLCLQPVAGLFWSRTRVASIVALAAITAVYASASRWLTRFHLLNAIAFPWSAVLFLYAISRSAVFTLLQGGVWWRGTFYRLSELRERAAKL